MTRHLTAALRMVRAYVRHPDRRVADRVAWTTAWDQVIALPILFTDGDGLKFVLHPGRNEGVYVEAGGNYETDEVALCRRLVGPGTTVFDVGANIGMYSLLFAAITGSEGEVHAFEPEPRNAERLRLHLLLNPGVGPVRLHEAAVGRAEGTVTLHAFEEAYNAWHSLAPIKLPDPFHPGQIVQSTRAIDVPCVTLDNHCERHDVDRIGLLKIDVEGGELGVLHGAADLLSRRAIDHVLFEVSLPQIEAFGADPSEIFAMLAEAGYKARAINRGGSLGPAVMRAERDYGNYLAEPAT